MSRLMGTMVLATSIVVANAVTVRAQGMRPIHFGLAAGSSVPTGAFGDRVNNGFAIDGNAAYRLGHSPLGLRADVAYSRFGLSHGFLAQFPGADNGRANVWSGTLNLTVNGPRRWRLQPYVLGGGGVYNRKVLVQQPVGRQVTVFDPFFGFFNEEFTAQETVRSHTETKLGFDAGGGVRVRTGRLQTFVEARWNHVRTTGSHTGFVPIMIGFEW